MAAGPGSRHASPLQAPANDAGERTGITKREGASVQFLSILGASSCLRVFVVRDLDHLPPSSTRLAAQGKDYCRGIPMDAMAPLDPRR
jgi:hypothetical protein